MPAPEEPRKDEGASLQQIQEPVLAVEPTINDDEEIRNGQDAQILIEGVPLRKKQEPLVDVLEAELNANYG